MYNTKVTNLHFQRFEFKYLLPASLADILIPQFLKYMEWDPYVIDKSEKYYSVLSLYYDSEGLGCYYDKLAGLEERKKLRIRTYDKNISPDTKVFIELKRKDDALVFKDRIITTYENYFTSFINGNYESFKKSSDTSIQKFLQELIWFKEYNGLMPKVMIIYQRMPLFSKMDKKFRVTFDSNLMVFPSEELRFADGIPVAPESVIMEVKYNNVLPSWFHAIIQDFQLERISVSKYCLGIESCLKKYIRI